MTNAAPNAYKAAARTVRGGTSPLRVTRRGPPRPRVPSRPPRDLRERGLALLLECVAALLRLIGHVEEQRRVPCQLLHARLAIEHRVERRLQHAQRHRGEREHFLAPANRLFLE